MTKNKPQYLVDEKGRKKAVLLSINDYKGLLAKIEDLEDSLELEEAVRTEKDFKDYREVQEDLKSEGLL